MPPRAGGRCRWYRRRASHTGRQQSPVAAAAIAHRPKLAHLADSPGAGLTAPRPRIGGRRQARQRRRQPPPASAARAPSTSLTATIRRTRTGRDAGHVERLHRTTPRAPAPANSGRRAMAGEASPAGRSAGMAARPCRGLGVRRHAGRSGGHDQRSPSATRLACQQPHPAGCLHLAARTPWRLPHAGRPRQKAPAAPACAGAVLAYDAEPARQLYASPTSD